MSCPPGGPEDLGERQPLPLSPLDSRRRAASNLRFVPVRSAHRPTWNPKGIPTFPPSWPGLRPWTRGWGEMQYLARNEDAGRPHATIPHAALCEGSERKVVFRQRYCSGCGAGPAGASRVLGPLGRLIGRIRSRAAATLRVAGLRLCGGKTKVRGKLRCRALHSAVGLRISPQGCT